MARRGNKVLTLALVLAVLATAYAQGPSDTGNQPASTPTTAAPVPSTTAPTPTTTAPTPTTKKTPTTGGSTDDGSGSSSAATPTPTTTAPTPTKTTKAPTTATTNATPAPSATTATPVPAVTTVAPEILVDRTVKSEYGTRAPATNDTTTSTQSSSTASKMGSWLVPAVIGAVVVAALIVMTFFVRSHQRNVDEDYTTPRRGSDNFLEHPKSNTHHVAVPVLEDQAKGKVEQASYKTVPVGGALHSPRANRVASSPPMLSEINRPGSPGFGAYKPKNVEGSSVGL